MSAVNTRERVSLAFLGLFFLAGLGLVGGQFGGARSRQPKRVPFAQAAGWNRQLAKAREVDVNTATRAELERLPGLGPALANRIVEERSRNGPFSSVEGIKRVSGIGDKQVESLRPRLVAE